MVGMLPQHSHSQQIPIATNNPDMASNPVGLHNPDMANSQVGTSNPDMASNPVDISSQEGISKDHMELHQTEPRVL